MLQKLGEEITMWEKNILQKNIKIATNRLIKEKMELEKHEVGTYSKAQMGSVRYREVLAELDRLGKLESKKGYQFRNLITHINNFGTYDYEMRKAFIYRENYLNTIKKQFFNLDGYDKLKEKFERIKNPIDFFKMIKSTGNDNIIDLDYVSDNTLTQEQFYKFLEDFNIDFDKTEEVVEN